MDELIATARRAAAMAEEKYAAFLAACGNDGDLAQVDGARVDMEAHCDLCEAVTSRLMEALQRLVVPLGRSPQ
ncbi:hypothetical protein FN976_17300 [Caenimonas sedimenti]|uniref:Uncharacterized protein n=1 Tax=Caenimonas sedimenti TaxID=2596921 RepID=A0A562ZNB8_9BURK|nr:hypothetical protein [Caenimonas sedimenti]TWO70092.1 hypothetical protein FN976_17300 [Caenimonas sedimenti]